MGQEEKEIDAEKERDILEGIFRVRHKNIKK